MPTAFAGKKSRPPVGIGAEAHHHTRLVTMLADKDGGGEGHAEVPAVKKATWTNVPSVTLSLRKIFEKELYHRVCDIVGESPQGETEGDEDKRQDELAPSFRYQRLLMLSIYFI